MQLVRDGQVGLVTPSLFTDEAERVTIPKMPAQFDSNPRTEVDCPHLRSGLRHFHDPSIWPNQIVPAPSSSITLPENTSVLISSCSLSETETYTFIRVPASSQLIFADAPIHLRVRSTLMPKSIRTNLLYLTSVLPAQTCMFLARFTLDLLHAASMLPSK
jgi:hypothetical protein